MPVRARIDASASVDDRERREAEEIHLQHPDFLERVHVVLRDNRRFVVSGARAFRSLRADRHVFVERARCDHDARRVHTCVTRQSFECDREIQQLAIPLFVPVQLSDFRNLVDRFS